MRYDEYWRERCDRPSTRARSERRARLALELLEADGARAPSRACDRPWSLVEVGCGPGVALDVFASAGYDAEGTDISDVALEAARARGLRVAKQPIESIAEVGSSPVDVIVALEVLEHIVDPLAALRSMARRLAPGGRLVVSLPNELHLLARLAILCGRPPFGGHDDPHLRHFDGRSARSLFAAADLAILARRSDSVVPPRLGVAARLGSWLAALSPGLFAISNVFLLAPNHDTARGSSPLDGSRSEEGCRASDLR